MEVWSRVHFGCVTVIVTLLRNRSTSLVAACPRVFHLKRGGSPFPLWGEGLLEPRCECFLVHCPCRQRIHGLNDLNLGRVCPEAVHFQKDGSRNKCRSLVTINEWMVLADAVPEGGRELMQRRLAPIDPEVSGARKRRIQEIRVAETSLASERSH